MTEAQDRRFDPAVKGLGHNGGPQIVDPIEHTGGYYIAWRDDLNDEIVGVGRPVAAKDESRPSYTRFEAWHWMRAHANWEAGTIKARGRVMTLNRGDLLGAYSYLGDVWNWTPKAVRGFVEALVRSRRASRVDNEQASNVPTVISVLDYDTSSRPDTSEAVQNAPATRASNGAGKGASNGAGNGAAKAPETQDNSSVAPSTRASNGTSNRAGNGAILKEDKPIEEGNIPSPNGDGRAAPAEPEDFMAEILWNHMRRWLNGVYPNLGDHRVRAYLGKLCKDYDLGYVLAVMRSCTRNKAVDPMPYMIEALKAYPKKDGTGPTPRAGRAQPPDIASVFEKAKAATKAKEAQP